MLADLDAVRWFGLVSAASAITYLVATSVAGARTDQFGPRQVLLASLALFGVANVASGLAPTWEVLIAARALSGIAEGGLDVALVVMVAELLPPALRAKLYAAFATAWILPSLVGPGIAGAATQLWGWRAAFLIPLVLLAPIALALAAPLRQVAPRAGRAWTATEKRTAYASAIVATAVAVLTWSAAAAAAGQGWALALVAASLAALGLRLRHALPAGSMRLSGTVPSAIGLTLMVSVAFVSLGAYLPLLFSAVLHTSPLVTGSTLSVTGVFWALGSNIASRDAIRLHLAPGSVVRIGMTLMTVGGLGPLLLATGTIGMAPGLLGWSLCGIGMGMVNNTLSVVVVNGTADDERGAATAGRTVSAAAGTALATAFGGALVAGNAQQLTGRPFAILITAGLLVAALTALLAPRVGR